MAIKSGTVLVTMELGKKLYFAADRRISWGWGKAASTPTKKVVKRNGILMSGTGSASLIFEIIHRSKIPVYEGKQSVEKYVYDKLLPAIIGDLRHKGYVDAKERRLVSRNLKESDDLHAVVLIGVKSKKERFVFEMELTADMITLDRVPLDYAHGCGGSFALAILQFCKKLNFYKPVDTLPKTMIGGKECVSIEPIYTYLDMDAEDILEAAVTAAADNSPGCDYDCDIEVL